MNERGVAFTHDRYPTSPQIAAPVRVWVSECVCEGVSVCVCVCVCVYVYVCVYIWLWMCTLWMCSSWWHSCAHVHVYLYVEMAAEKSEPLCSHHVVNDDLTRAVDEFTSIIQQELATYGE